VIRPNWTINRWFAAIMIAILGMGFNAAQIGHAETLAGDDTHSAEQDKGPYFRLKVQLAYMGEPQHFDIVVGCKVLSHIHDNITHRGLVPTVFGRRMRDGKGLVVRPPRACDGQTAANGEVQPDLLPIVIVYDDADTLDFGTAYLSEDAYNSPLSVLKFGGARIEKASRDDFDEFRRTQTNLVTREVYWSALASDSVLAQMHLERPAKPWGHVCEGYTRYRLPEELRAVVRLNWPSSRPDYWLPDTFDTENKLKHMITSSLHIQSDDKDSLPRPIRQLGGAYEESTNIGLRTRSGGGLVSPTRGKLFPGAFYPSTYDDRANKWPTDSREKAEYLAAHNYFAYADIDFRGGVTKGFAYCATRIGFRDASLMRSLLQKSTITRVDSQIIRNRRPAQTPNSIFERDEYVLIHFQIYLESTGGDV
jgi:hypothetical protein